MTIHEGPDPAPAAVECGATITDRDNEHRTLECHLPAAHDFHRDGDAAWTSDGVHWPADGVADLANRLHGHVLDLLNLLDSLGPMKSEAGRADIMRARHAEKAARAILEKPAAPAAASAGLEGLPFKCFYCSHECRAASAGEGALRDRIRQLREALEQAQGALDYARVAFDRAGDAGEAKCAELAWHDAERALEGASVASAPEGPSKAVESGAALAPAQREGK